MNEKNRTLQMTMIAMLAAVIAVCSWITIPMPIGVPFTLQTFAIFLTLMLLGGVKGLITVVLYIVIGAIGVPVFAGFNGGYGVLLGPTGGYIIGFIFMALAYIVCSKLIKNIYIEVAVLVLGLILCYAFGTAWIVITKTAAGSPFGIMAALSACVFPYIIPDLAKLTVALIIAKQLKKLSILHKI